VEEGVQGTQTCSSEHLLRYRWLFKQAAAQHGFVGEKVRECVDKYCSNSFKNTVLNASFNQTLNKHVKTQWYKNKRKLFGDAGQDLKNTKVIDVDWYGVFNEYKQRHQLFGFSTFNTPQFVLQQAGAEGEKHTTDLDSNSPPDSYLFWSDEENTHEASFWQKAPRFIDDDASTEDAPPKSSSE